MTIRLFSQSTTTLLLLALTLLPSLSKAAEKKVTPTAQIAPVVLNQRLKVMYRPGMRMDAFKGYRDDDILDLGNGKQVSVGLVRRLDEFQQRLRRPAVDRMPAGLRMRPAATGEVINNMNQLSTLLKTRQDTHTLQIKGRPYTVGQVKVVQDIVEQRLGVRIGRQLDPLAPVTTIRSKMSQAEWQQIAQKSPDTVIAMNGQKLMTVGELRKAFEAMSAARSGVSLPPRSPQLSRLPALMPNVRAK